MRKAPLSTLFLSSIALQSCLVKEEDAPTVNLEAIKALPYVSAVDSPTDQEGVVLWDPERAYPALSTFSSQTQKKGFLMDLDGTMTRIWSFDDGVGHVEVNDAGELFVLRVDEGLLKVDWDGNELWFAEIGGHHDFDFAENGDIYLVTRKAIKVQHEGAVYPILNDYIHVLTADGEIRKSFSLYDLVGRHISKKEWEAIAAYLKDGTGKDGQNQKKAAKPEKKVAANTPYDVFHTNAVEILRRDVPGIAVKGDLLLSVRQLNMVLITDPELREVRWSFGPGEIWRQHRPSLVDNGHILLFDNGNSKRGSRVIEVDPRTDEIVWMYPKSPAGSFFSSFRGAAQRLPNGNTLITDSANGRAFEVTLDGEIVWMYYAPKTDEKKREVIYEMLRVWGAAEQKLRRRAIQLQ